MKISNPSSRSWSSYLSSKALTQSESSSPQWYLNSSICLSRIRMSIVEVASTTWWSIYMIDMKNLERMKSSRDHWYMDSTTARRWYAISSPDSGTTRIDSTLIQWWGCNSSWISCMSAMRKASGSRILHISFSRCQAGAPTSTERSSKSHCKSVNLLLSISIWPIRWEWRTDLSQWLLSSPK